MKVSHGMEPMVLSYAYYRVVDFERVMDVLKELDKKGLFSIDEHRPKRKEMKGTFIRDYPKGHWNPLARMAGAKQVVGGAEVEKGILTIDTKNKAGLKEMREMLEGVLGSAIEFQRVEYDDFMKRMRKKAGRR